MQRGDLDKSFGGGRGLRHIVGAWTSVALGVALLSAVAAVPACGGDSKDTAACVDHTECQRGTFCRLGECVEQPCVSDGDCGGTNVVCLRDLGMCGAKECEPGAAVGAAGACPEGKICDGGTCIDDVPLPPADTTDGKDPSQPETVEEVVEGPAAPCAPCGAELPGCGEGMSCEQLGASKNCLPQCTVDGDCASGWNCYQLTSEAKVCVPSSFQCTAPCLQTGCPEGQACDPRDPAAENAPETAGQCVAALATCDECTYDWECGVGNRCMMTQAGFQFCVAECAAEADCESWATCAEKRETAGQGVMGCMPKNASCCGPECGIECNPACTGTRPHCAMGVCVECTENSHCFETGGECVENSCVGGPCEGNATNPYPCPGGEGCCQCLIDEHCGGDVRCNPTLFECVDDPCGGACIDPYPACAVINGAPTCVPCTEDAHCLSNDCDEATYMCADVGCEIQNCAREGCPTGTNFDLKCDTDTGCCYDAAGSCDNTVAFCRESSGSECKSLLEMFSGGMGGMPGMGELPTDGIGGMCSCSAAMSTVCRYLPNTPGCDIAGLCYGDDLRCMPISTIMDLLMGMGGAPGQALMGGDFCIPFSWGDLLGGSK